MGINNSFKNYGGIKYLYAHKNRLDENKDGKIDEKEIQKGGLSAEAQLDITGDKEVTLEDVLKVEENVDINGDLKTSYEERRFMKNN